MPTASFGVFIKKTREDRKLSLRDVEGLAKVSNAYLSQVERGERGIPNIKVLRRLADAYSVPLGVLIAAAEAAEERVDRFPEVPSPDLRVVSRGYEKLSPDRKKALMSFLHHLIEEERKNKRR